MKILTMCAFPLLLLYLKIIAYCSFHSNLKLHVYIRQLSSSLILTTSKGVTISNIEHRLDGSTDPTVGGIGLFSSIGFNTDSLAASQMASRLPCLLAIWRSALK
ncbi:hypothetical protein F5Y11DRAFT_336214 [Daldinia sp. FL1419]|nr:hypothetical protein F5Y11DRAFT_336214 [Daldinia sp. FL1419]